MKTNFKEYLEKKKAQSVIDKIAEKYKDKKIILYGAGIFSEDLFRNYDFSKLDILGIADRDFKDHLEGDFCGYNKIGVYDLLEMDFDLLLITAYDDTDIKDFLKNDLLQGEDVNFKVKTLIKLNIFEYTKELLNGEI